MVAQEKKLRLHSDIIAGAIFFIIACAFGFEASQYAIGSTIRMGPGFIPLALSIMLGILGLAVAGAGWRRSEDVERDTIPWRGIVLTCAALVIFGAYGRNIGLVPAVFICALLTSLSSRSNSILSAIGISLSLSALSWVIFKVGLGVSLPTIGAAFGPFQYY